MITVKNSKRSYDFEDFSRVGVAAIKNSTQTITRRLQEIENENFSLKRELEQISLDLQRERFGNQEIHRALVKTDATKDILEQRVRVLEEENRRSYSKDSIEEMRRNYDEQLRKASEEVFYKVRS